MAGKINPIPKIDLIHKKLDFRWEVLDVIVGGKSLIDTELGLTGFPMRSHDDVDRFMKSYGYDLEDPIEKAEVLGNFHEALNFIREYFLDSDWVETKDLTIPRKITEMTDVRDLLLMASHHYPGQMHDREGRELQLWACAVLKIVHTIAHIDRDSSITYFSDIQQQILDRFYRYIHRTSDGQLFLGIGEKDPLRVNLVAFETKPRKSRDSLVLKLLHKAENVSDDVFDQVGLRLVTHTRLEALRAVKYLKDSMLVMPANIKPSRSRNSLVDIESFRQEMEGILAEADQGKLSEARVVEQLEKAIRPPSKVSGANINPHTSESYQAIQFTCRQLIKIVNPLYEQISQLKLESKKQNPDDSPLNELVDRIDLRYVQKEVRFFYPYEVQIMDAVAQEENERGKGAHSEYKKAQVKTAMHRVLGSLLRPDKMPESEKEDD